MDREASRQSDEEVATEPDIGDELAVKCNEWCRDDCGCGSPAQGGCDGITIETRDPEDGQVGSISARTGGEFGPEVCWAVGHEFGEWYVVVNQPVAEAAGVEHQRTQIACHRQEAEYLVRLIAGLFERARK